MLPILTSLLKRLNFSYSKLKKTVTERSIRVDENGAYVISINLVLTDDSVEVINRNISQNHNPVNSISIARNELIRKAQIIINSYKADKAIRESSEFADIVSNIDNGLEV